MRRFGRTLRSAVMALLVLQLGCGTILYPEREASRSGG
jgi:hypothetical protein